MKDWDDDSDEPEGDEAMGFFEHITELRTRLIRILLGMIPGVAVAWMFRETLLDYLARPLAIAWRKLGLGEPTLHIANPVDGFLAYLKISLVMGLLASAPWAFWQIWAFIAPGLYRHEKRFAIPFAFFSTVCFLGGAAFGYSIVFPLVFETLLEFTGELPSHGLTLQPTLMVNEYLNFAVRLLLAFGVVFEIPVVISFLAASGLVTWRQLLRFSRWWVLIAAVLAALLTPPDIGSQLLMLVPLILLYFLSVLLAMIFQRNRKEEEPEETAEAE